MNILLVDDEAEYRMLLGHYLETEGYTVFLAENGEAGLDKLEDASMDLIISDIYMPVMDGLKFYKHVRSAPKFKNIPFLFVSGFDDDHTISAVKSSKLDGFIKKARPLNELKAWIKYLTTPIDKRPSIPPTSSAVKLDRDRSRDRSLRSNR
ncbi:MAG: response regulator [Ignavibacteriales bacterium]|nr:response regulator [Ignavibacteriales bacterium]